jgi:hypothetical protein
VYLKGFYEGVSKEAKERVYLKGFYEGVSKRRPKRGCT